jgi:hypothetical protein
MTIASLGDSRTLVYGPRGPRGPRGPLALLFETTDQDCADEQEKKRLGDLGLVVFEEKTRAGGAVLHSTGVYRCSTAGGRDLMTMSSFGDSVHDVPRGAVTSHCNCQLTSVIERFPGCPQRMELQAWHIVRGPSMGDRAS